MGDLESSMTVYLKALGGDYGDDIAYSTLACLCARFFSFVLVIDLSSKQLDHN